MNTSFAYYVMTLRNDFIEFCNMHLQDLDITQGQLFFILYIGKHEGCSPKQLSQGLDLDNGHTTRTLAKLEEKGFILQKLNSKDKRAHLLSLTQKGYEALHMSHELLSKWDESVLCELENKQREELLEIMSVLIKDKKIHKKCGKDD